MAIVSGCTRGTASQLLASGSNDCSLRIWDVDAGAPLGVLQGHTRGVNSVASLGGGRLLSGSEDGSLRVWDVDSKACLAVVNDSHGRRVFAVAALGGDRLAASGGEDGVRPLSKSVNASRHRNSLASAVPAQRLRFLPVL